MTRARATIGYRVRVGDLTIASDARGGPQLLRLTSALTMDGVGGRARLGLVLGEVRPPRLGASITIDLDGGGGADRVFSGTLRAIRGAPAALCIDAADGLATLAGRSFVGSFQEADAAAIARAILDAAGLKAGALASGPTFHRYVAHPGRSALAHLQELARRCGLDLYTDREGAVTMTQPTRCGRTRQLQFPGEPLTFALERRALATDSLIAIGEGASSTRGRGREHWLADDLGPVTASARIDADARVGDGRGVHPDRVVDGALRSGEAAATIARERVASLAARACAAQLTLAGDPTIALTDLLEVKVAPRFTALAAVVDGARLRVRGVVHRLDPRRGYTTEVEV